MATFSSTIPDPLAFGGINPAYLFSGNKLQQEWQRLDDQHDGFSRYLGGKLSFAPLEAPKHILDMGAGTGAWAAQAANQYPDAEILAVDMSPLPARTFPPNLRFQQLDLLHEFPWEQESFDVIHLRLLLYHIPHPSKFIHRVISLLKPNGWIIAEDCCLLVFPRASGPAQQERNKITSAFLLSKGQDPEIGAHVEAILQESGAFSKIYVKEELLTFTPLPDDSSVRPLAEMMKNSVIRTTTRSPSDGLVAAGMNQELRSKWEEEMNDPRYDPTQHFFFVWACKRS